MKFKKVIKKLLKNPTAVIGLLIILAFAIIAIFAPMIAPPPENSHDPQMIPRDGNSLAPRPPNAEHPFGTTVNQYDIFYGVVWGTRTAFRIGIVITVVTTLMGIIIGSISAFYGGWVDELLMRITDIFLAFPRLLTAIILTTIMQILYERGSGIMLQASKMLAFFTFGHNLNEMLNPIQVRFLSGMIAIIVFGWMTVAKVTRGNVLKEMNLDYAQAALVIGTKNSRILFRHLLPNAMLPALVVSYMNFGTFVLTFAALGFLGIIQQPGYADWGQMISYARDWITSLDDFSYIVIFPSLAIVLFISAWNLVGDALQDILDPRIKNVG